MKKSITLVAACIGLSSIGAQAAIQYEQTFGGLTTGDLAGQAGFQNFGADLINVVNGFSLGGSGSWNYNTQSNITTAPGIVRGPVDDGNGFGGGLYYNFNSVSIDWDTAGEHWISYYFTQTNLSASSENSILLLDNSFTTQAQIGAVNADYSVYGGAAAGGSSTGITGGGAVNFALIKITTQASVDGNDTIEFSVFDPNTEVLPTVVSSFEGSQSVDVTGATTSWALRMANFDFADDSSQFDQFVFGQNYLDVTGVPEPSSYALLSGLLALGWIMIRRRK